MREAAGQLRCRGRGDDRGRRARGRAAECGRWWVSPTAGSRPWRWPVASSSEGRVGEVRHVRAQYLQDWIADPEAPLSWRLEKEKAGSGALGDIGAHVIDLTQFITGDRITEVSGRLETFVKERPLPTEHSGLSGTAGEERGAVTVDDAAAFIAHFTGGALGVFEATRFATGRKNAIRIEINGSRGSLAFDFEDMNVLELYDATEPDETAGFRRILVTEATHPYVGAWWPPGHGLGIRARLHPPGGRPGPGDRRRHRAAAHVRRRPPGAARAGCDRDELRHPQLAGGPTVNDFTLAMEHLLGVR